MTTPNAHELSLGLHAPVQAVEEILKVGQLAGEIAGDSKEIGLGFADQFRIGYSAKAEIGLLREILCIRAASRTLLEKAQQARRVILDDGTKARMCF